MPSVIAVKDKIICTLFSLNSMELKYVKAHLLGAATKYQRDHRSLHRCSVRSHRIIE